MKRRITNIIKNHFIDLDLSKKSTIMISGMGRSGTTWLSELINADGKYRDIFEPFYPYKVEVAKYFRYLQYLNPENNKADLINPAKRILSGNFRSNWTDVNISQLISTKRIIKDIRANLMLGWLKRIRPEMPLILIIRSPYSVIDSYKYLGWGIEAGGTKSDFDRIVEQDELLSDFVLINNVYKSIDHQDYITKLIFQWCVLYYVPLNQLSKKDFILIQYENLLLYPEKTLLGIFNYLEKDVDLSVILKNIENPSNTNYRKIDFKTDKSYLIEKWKKSLSQSDIIKINEILKYFNMDYLYNENGFPNDLGE